MFPTGRKGIIRYLSTIPGPTETDPTASYLPPNKTEGIHCSIPLKNSMLPSEVLLWDLSTTTEIERWNDLWEEEPFPESIIQASLWEIFTCISQDKQRALRIEFFASAPAKIRCLVNGLCSSDTPFTVSNPPPVIWPAQQSPPIFGECFWTWLLANQASHPCDSDCGGCSVVECQWDVVQAPTETYWLLCTADCPGRK